VETELSVAQASTDMIATGVLDYAISPVNDEADKDVELELEEATQNKKSAT
jgi:hypothetical protein